MRAEHPRTGRFADEIAEQSCRELGDDERQQSQVHEAGRHAGGPCSLGTTWTCWCECTSGEQLRTPTDVAVLAVDDPCRARHAEVVPQPVSELVADCLSLALPELSEHL